MLAAKEDIVDSTCGVVFLGTPHYGSRLSTPAAAAAFVSGVFGSDTTLLYSLTYGSKQLSELEESFGTLVKNQTDRGKKLEIVSFRETMKTYILGWVSIGLVSASASYLNVVNSLT